MGAGAIQSTLDNVKQRNSELERDLLLCRTGAHATALGGAHLQDPIVGQPSALQSTISVGIDGMSSNNANLPSQSMYLNTGEARRRRLSEASSSIQQHQSHNGNVRGRSASVPVAVDGTLRARSDDGTSDLLAYLTAVEGQ